MIINCENCNKKFQVNDNLIPSEGRLLQCSRCEHKWFFRKDDNIVEKDEIKINQKINKKNEIKIPEKVDTPKKTQSTKKITKKAIKKEIKTKEFAFSEKNENKNKIQSKRINYFKIFLVFIISLISLIILIDTFKYQIEHFIPNINDILNNLYETLKDIKLFFKDLIN